MDVDDLRTFVEVADAGGVSAASRRLNLAKSIVSRRLLRLEAELGTQLLARTTRGAALTEAADPGAAAARQSAHWAGRAAGWLRRRLRRMDRESYTAYALFVAAFVADFSVLMAYFPLSTFLYALVSSRPSRRYWTRTAEVGYGVKLGKLIP